MNLVADESIDRAIVERLRQDGHQVWYIAEMEPGITDDEVLAIANRVQAILITADRDFGEIVFRRRLHTHGIILLRLAGLSPERKADLVASAIVQHETELRQAFAVITPAILRIRITDQ